MAENENEKKTNADESSEAKKSVKAEKKANKKPSLGSRISKFWREYKSELKKIVWYSRKETINSTILVLISIIVFSVVISALDLGFSSALLALGRLI